MTTSADYRAYTRTREYKRLSFKTKMKLAFAEEKRQWNERGWFYRVVVVCIFRPLIMVPLTLAIMLIMWTLALVLFVARGIIELLSHWQTYAILLLIGMVLILVHLGII